MLPVKIRPAIPKLWQVEHEVNNKIDIYEVVIVVPISCGDTECLFRWRSVNINTNRGQSLGEGFLYQESADGRVMRPMWFYNENHL